MMSTDGSATGTCAERRPGRRGSPPCIGLQPRALLRQKGELPMTAALVCTALLGLLVVGLGLGVSTLRGSTSTNIGHKLDPGDPLHKMVRAHGNATEYAPMLAILMLAIAGRGASPWMVWTFVAATLSRYLHA